MFTRLEGKIGLIADSHGKISQMLDAIKTLKDMGAATIIHLGDICDSLRPECLDEAVEILHRYKVKAVLGNNEYILITEYLANHADGFNDIVVSFLKELPYTLNIGDFCFTHSIPFNWPAATNRPLTEYLPRLLENGSPPFKVLFRGHSHTPSVIEIEGGCSKEIGLKSGDKIALDKDRIYVVNVGAIEDGAFALFDPINHEFNSLTFTSNPKKT